MNIKPHMSIQNMMRWVIILYWVVKDDLTER